MRILLYLLITAIFLSGYKPAKPQIAKIDFEAGACYGTCPIFKMTIAKDGTAKYEAEKFNKQEGQFTAIIKTLQFDSLTSLIEKADVFSLNYSYTIPVTDHPTYYLTVALTNGKTKSIKDYGPSGPDKLKKIYRLIFSLRETQDWK